MKARTCLSGLFTPVMLIVLAVSPSRAVPLLQVDFGSPLPSGPAQAGFQGMWGTNDHPAVATLGAFTVQLSANSSMTGTQSSRGFFDKLSGFGGRIDNTDPSIRDFYRDFFFNRSTINGEGIDLKISGLTPNQAYNLTLTSYDADASNNPLAFTPQNWGPKAGSNTTGTTATINLLREPWPTSLWDPLHTGTIQVSTSTGILDIFGTTTGPGTRGTVLNGFKLNDGANDVLLVDLGEGAPAGNTQPGFFNFSGPHFDATGPTDSASETIGAYTVSVERIGGAFGDTGFYNELAIRNLPEVLPPATHNLFRDCFCSISANPGEGILLTVNGVTPNTDYDLTIWDMDPAAGASTIDSWSPVNDTTGDSATIDLIRTPVPKTLYDPNHLRTIRVKSTNTKLEIFGTSVSGFGGVRLNAIELNAVIAGDYNKNGVVDAADYLVWRKSDGQTGVTPGSGADGDGNGTINSLDFDFWKARFGNPTGTGSGSVGHGAVPEPSTALLVLLAGLASVAIGRGRR
jgi:Dockerin type I domain